MTTKSPGREDGGDRGTIRRPRTETKTGGTTGRSGTDDRRGRGTTIRRREADEQGARRWASTSGSRRSGCETRTSRMRGPEGRDEDGQTPDSRREEHEGARPTEPDGPRTERSEGPKGRLSDGESKRPSLRTNTDSAGQGPCSYKARLSPHPSPTSFLGRLRESSACFAVPAVASPRLTPFGADSTPSCRTGASPRLTPVGADPPSRSSAERTGGRRDRPLSDRAGEVPAMQRGGHHVLWRRARIHRDGR